MVRARVDLGMTQEEAARAIGVDVRTLRRYESGEVNAKGFASNRSSRRSIVARIARELGVAESELLVEVAQEDAPRAASSSPVVREMDVPSALPAGHVLPRPRVFEGRDALVERLRVFVASARDARLASMSGPSRPGSSVEDAASRSAGREDVRVIAIVGVGGAGKTAVVARATASSPPEGVLAWSFYEEPRVDAFLAAVSARPDANLLVLDGLEVLQADGSTGRARGELEDARLRRLLRDVAAHGAHRALVTSRFEIADLHGFEGFETISIEPLSEDEASRVLARWGVTGNVERLARAAGGHALATVMLASLATTAFEGDADRVPGIDVAEAAHDDPFARRLAAVLDGLAAGLSPIERDVLACVAIYPRGIPLASLERLAEVTSKTEAIPPLRGLTRASRDAIARAVGVLSRRGLVVRGSGEVVTTHPILRAHFRTLLGAAPELVHDVERRAIAKELALSGPALAERPRAAPRDVAELDAYERFFDHTRWAGDWDGAAEILHRAVGGFSHLGLRLGAFERGLRMARALAREPTELEPALDPRPTTLSKRLSPPMRVRVAYEWGLYAGALGDLDTALDAYGESNRAALELGDLESFVTGLRTTAYTLRLRGDVAGARAAIDQSLALAEERSLGHARVRGLALSAALHVDEGDVERATRAFATARALGDVPFARRAIWEAEVRAAAGATDEARSILEATASACERIGWTGHAAHARACLGLLRPPDDGAASEADLAVAKAWADRTGEVEIRLLVLELEERVAVLRGDARGARSTRDACRALATRFGFGWFLRRLEQSSARG